MNESTGRLPAIRHRDQMSLEPNNYRDLLEPQDALAGLITILGIAIALFLDDAIVKLIGACIAVLGGVALYMTLKTRMHDRVQIRKRRTTLPTPSFKTRVTTDPTTSAKRIRFDDFQETFAVAEDEEDAPVSAPTAAPTPRPMPAVAQTPSPQAAAPGSTIRFDDFGDGGGDYDDVTINTDFVDASGVDAVDVEEGFTIVSDKTGSTAPSARTESPAPSKVAAPSVEKTKTPPAATPEPTEAQGGGERKKKRGKKKRKGGERTERPAAQTSSPPPQKREPVAAPSPEPEPTPVPTPDPVLNTTEISETDTTPDAPVPERRAVRRQIQMVFEELSGDDAPSGSREPRVEFVRLVNQVLKGIARSIDGRSIVFFWVNLERGHFIPEAAVTRGDDPLRVGERITLGSDLVSQIARGGVPEIVTNISPAAAAELTPYYGSGLRTGSFVGVPVFFRNEVVGVLAADSAEEEGFDEAAVATLAEYTILISQLIGDYAEKFDLYLVRRSIEAFESMNDSLTGAAQRPFEVARYLVDEIADMFDADYVGAILYDRREGAWRIAASRSDEPALRGRLDRIAPDMGSSIAGEAARRATEIYIPSVSDETLVAPGETLLDGGSYLAVPLMAASKCYGSLILGNARTNAWVSRDVELMRDLTRYAAMAIEVINTNAALDEQMIYDEQTGLYNSRFFMRGFEREVDRAHDFKATLSLALVRVEIPDSFGGDRRAELHHTSVAEIGALLTRKVRPYDLLGRFDNETFSVALVGRSDQEAFLWAEQLRKEIAGHIIPFDAGNYSVTISAGVCNATDTSQTDNVIEGAHKALEKAGKDGGNGVVIY